jgi:hypothetical protein
VKKAGKLTLALVLAAAGAPARAAEPAPPPADGFHATPSLFWKQGDWRVDLGAAVRVRSEGWDAMAEHTDWYTGLRSRLRLQVGWRETLIVAAEGQDLRVHGLASDTTGPPKLYRDNSGKDSNTHGTDLRQLYVEARPWKGASLRLGRQDVKLGTEVLYPEPDWRYLKTQRLGERFVGTVGWSQVERAYDGGSGGVDLGGHHVSAFFTQPTTGVFDVDSAYRRNQDILVGGAAWTVKRDTWLPGTELGAFAIYYEDERDRDDGGLAHGLELTTIGVQAVGILPAGPGRFDWLVLVAGQWGDYDDLDHEGFAGLLELGYQLPDLFLAPWLRVGVNASTGDHDPADDHHATFFNLLPTNHLYYGFADQLALQNLVNPFVQLRLKPHAMVGLNLFLHRFTLATSDDAKYGGTGAFNRKAFGFPATPSRGYRYVGTELDAVVTVTPHKAVTFEAGYAKLWGGKMLRGDVRFGYVSLELKY